MYGFRNKLTAMVDRDVITVEMMEDIRWWKTFMAKYNGVSILWMHQKLKTDEMISSDSCLTGMGACCGDEYLHSKFPQEFMDSTKYRIHHLELIAVIMALHTWKRKLHRCRFVMHYDNKAVVDVVNTGYTKDRTLQKLMRQLIYVAAVWQFEVILQYISSQDNRKSDILSRVHLGGKYLCTFRREFPGSRWKSMEVNWKLFNDDLNW